MLEHLEFVAAAAAVHRAVADLLADSGPRTADLGGTSTTVEVGNAIVERIRASVP
jgi:tartrate dehydrogenase/decarboxylase / D-malate dehydrogenase